ncbi:MAG: PAS domain S-box protein [Alphaproteobacteria bacterium]|nr:PAS domain S-box protein [Alphaproteobacteria bacterium]
MPFDPFRTEICAALSFGADGHVRRAGSGCRPILQLDPGALEGRSVFGVFDAEHADRLRRGIERVLAGAPSSNVRTRIVRPDGAMDVVIRMEADGDGVFAVVEDTSTRAAVLQSSSQMAKLVDFAADAWFVHDMEGRIRDANPWAAQSLGYTREEMLDLVVADFETTIQPGRMDGVWNRLDLGKPMSVTGRHRRKDGTEFPVSVRLGLFETDGDEVLMLAICRDITELKAAEARLEQLNEHLEDEVAARTSELRNALIERQAVLNNLADGLVAFDRELVVQVANPALGDLIGVQALPGASAIGALPDDLMQLVAAALQERAVAIGEVKLPRERIGYVVVSPTLADDELLGVVALVRDVTLEREIDRMKTDFIATVSHELRTPLTSVLGFAKITRNKLTSVYPHIPADDRKAQRAAQQAEKNLDIIVSEGERLTALINDVLDISKMEAGRMEWRFEPVDVGALAERAHAATTSLFESRVALRMQVDSDLPRVQADADRILQVLINLLSNAAKFTDSGRVTLGVHRVTGGVELSVADTGRGIDTSMQASVFDKFKQVGDTLTDKPRGTGLGLPICAQIVQAHGSSFALTSALGQGSRFSFVLSDSGALPTGAEPTVREARPAPAKPSRPGLDVLVVDDDPNLRELVHQQLTDRGYAVRLAANGYEAMKLVRQQRPGLVVLDVMMPVLSGFDVAAMLKGDPNTEGIPILILSIVRDEERGYRIGVDRYLTKPADADELALAVAELLRTPHDGAQA